MSSWFSRVRHRPARSSNAFWILLLTSFPLLAAAANPCAPPSRAPGTPIVAPHAVFEAYVVEVYAPQDSISASGVQRTQRALVEVSRSFHGPYSPGQEVETLTTVGAFACGKPVEAGGRVIVTSKSGEPFAIVKVLPKTHVVLDDPFAALAFARGEPRRGKYRSLKNSTLRGDIDPRDAAQLHARARPAQGETSQIIGSGRYAQVSWGEAFGGNDARFKVIFERAHGGWVEILRYNAPPPTPARRSRRSKRILWANESALTRPAVAWAATTS